MKHLSEPIIMPIIIMYSIATCREILEMAANLLEVGKLSRENLVRENRFTFMLTHSSVH